MIRFLILSTIYLVSFQLNAQDRLNDEKVPELKIGVTHQTITRAAFFRYSVYSFVPQQVNRKSASNPTAQFRATQPKFALPSANPSRPIAFNSRAADVVLSNLGEVVGGMLGGSNYKAPQTSYHDKYSLRVGTKP